MPSFNADGILRRQITLSVQAQGQQYITDLQAQITALDGSIQGYQAQLASGAINQQAFQNSTKGLLGDVARLKYELDLAQQAMRGKNIIPAETSEGFKNLSFSILSTSHALQDLQYGFGAIVNNIPLVTSSIAQAAGASTAYANAIAGSVMLVGTAINVTLPYIKQFGTSFATELGLINDPLRTAAVNTDQMKAKIEALTSRSWKVDFDYSMIEMAEKRLTLLEQRQKKWEEMEKARTPIEEESGKRANAAITGQGNMEGMVRAMTESMGKMGLLKMDTEAQRNLRSAEAEMEQLRRKMNDPSTTPFEFMTASGRNLVLESQMPGMKEAVRKEIRGIVQGELGAAGRGERQKVADVLAAVNANPDAFRNQGIDPMKLAAGLMGAEHQTIKDQRESDRFAADQARDAQRRKKLEDDRIEAMDRQGQESEAEMKRQIDARKTQEDQIRQQARQADADMKRREQEQKEAAREAEKKRKDDAKALDMTLKAAGNVDKDAEKDAEKAGKGFGKDYLANIQREFLENKRRELAGNGVVGTLQDFQFANQMGQQPALEDAVLQKWMASRVAVDLRRAGKDPGLAPRIVRDASDAGDEKWGQAMAKFGNQQDALISLMQEHQMQLAKIQQDMGRRDARIMQMQGQAGRMRNQKRTLLPHPAQK